jgi:hypothetical protein
MMNAIFSLQPTPPRRHRLPQFCDGSRTVFASSRRQSDCLSITQHMYRDKSAFLKFEIHWRGSITSGEFPSFILPSRTAQTSAWIVEVELYLMIDPTIEKPQTGFSQRSTLSILFLFCFLVRFWYYSNNFMMNTNAFAALKSNSSPTPQRKSYKQSLRPCRTLKITHYFFLFGVGATFV